MARGLSSAGRAPAWHAGGQRFDPARLHHYKKARESGPFLLLAVSSGRWRLGVVSCHSIARSLMKVSATFDRGKNFKTSWRSEEHTSELQSLMRTSYAVFCLKKKTQHKYHTT